MKLLSIIVEQPKEAIFVSDRRTKEYSTSFEMGKTTYWCKPKEAKLIRLIHEYNIALALCEKRFP
jgi:hypothetical protein